MWNILRVLTDRQTDRHSAAAVSETEASVSSWTARIVAQKSEKFVLFFFCPISILLVVTKQGSKWLQRKKQKKTKQRKTKAKYRK